MHVRQCMFTFDATLGPRPTAAISKPKRSMTRSCAVLPSVLSRLLDLNVGPRGKPKPSPIMRSRVDAGRMQHVFQ